MAKIIAPYYEHNGITIYCGDCREILPSLPKVDLVLTDPPYGLDIANNPFRQKFTKADWDIKPIDDTLIGLIFKCSHEQIIWGGNYFNLPPSQGFLIWDKMQPQNFSSAMCEFAWMSRKSPAKLFHKWCVDYQKYHPTQKPESLMVWCLELFPESKTILDPFMGSGTTLVASKITGRHCIGIEIEEKYCEIAVKRLSQEVMDFHTLPTADKPKNFNLGEM
jgi:site-specific DNA-methyltransferase (adenine-specific)/modification methylase